MSFRYPQPSNEDDFEHFCLRLLRELWKCPTLAQYGKRGERQDGIDLIDEGGNLPLRAVQCKHHEPDKTIPPAEIEAEVTKALGSGFALGEYYVLTTARKTVHSQKAVVRLNQDHAATGKFKVALWTWAEIEGYLSTMDEATTDWVLRGQTGRSARALSTTLTGVLTTHFDSPLYSSESALDAELDAAKAAADANNTEVATHILDKVEKRYADKLSDGQWYRIKAIRATLRMREGEWERAGTILLDAKRHQPATERARVNEALAYELLGDKGKAHELATALRTEFSHAHRPLAIWLRTAPEATPYSDLEAAGGSLPEEEELLLALAHRGLVAGQSEKAAGYAERATRKDPVAPQGHFQLALARHDQGLKAGGTRRLNYFASAEPEYDRAIELCRTQKLADLEATALVNRAILRRLRDDPRSEGDLAAAADRSPKPEFRLQYAGFLIDGERYADALREIGRIADRTEAEVRFLEAAARHGRNTGDDRPAARTALGAIIAAGPSDRWVDAHLLIAQWAVEDKIPKTASDIIRGSALASSSPLAYHALLAWLAHEQGDAETAEQEARAAAVAVEAGSPAKLLRLLAQVYLVRKEDDAALPLLERCATPGVFDTDGRRLLDCALRLRRHDIVQRICRELRLAGETDPRLIRTEIQVLQLYDVGEAFRVAEEYLAGHPDDKHVTLWRSHLAFRLERPEVVVAEPGRMPPPAELDPWLGQMAVVVLRTTGKFNEALRFSYELLREHFGEETAHGQYLWYFHILSPHVSELRVAPTVAVGTAVRYRETEEAPDQWVVIEPGPTPDGGRNEFPPDHHLAAVFLDRKVGDTVVLSSGAVQDRTATICEVLHRFVYRFQTCLNQFQINFPDSSACQLVRAGMGEAFDPTPFVKSLQDRREHIRQIDDLYQAHPLPVSTYTRWSGADEFAAWEHLASPRLGFRCCTGHRDELRAGLERTRDRGTVVLDISALHTLARLDLLRVLGSRQWKFVVSQATYDHFRDLEDIEERDPRERKTMALHDDQLVVIESTPEQLEEHARLVHAIPAAIKQSCLIRPCPAAAGLAPRKREQIDEVLGRSGLESMMLGAEQGAALWTDDGVVAIIAQSDFRTERVWTQAILWTLLAQGGLTPVEYERATAKLVGWHFNGMQMSPATLVSAAELADWDMSRWPVPQVMAPLGNQLTPPIARLQTAALAIKAVWRREDAQTSREGFLLAVLTGIRSLGLVRKLLGHVPDLFGVDVFSADEVADYIRYWMTRANVIVTR